MLIRKPLYYSLTLYIDRTEISALEVYRLSLILPFINIKNYANLYLSLAFAETNYNFFS